MPQLVALLPEDGWAFVREGSRFVLVHPPFRTSNRRVAPESFVVDAVLHHGFAEASPDCPDEPWPDVIARIRDEMRRAVGDVASAGAFLGRALRVVPMAMIKAILDDIERQLVAPRCKLEGAERALQRLLREERVRADAAALTRVIELLDLVATTRERQIEARRRAFVPERLLTTHRDPSFIQRSQSFRSDTCAGLFGG